MNHKIHSLLLPTIPLAWCRPHRALYLICPLLSSVRIAAMTCHLIAATLALLVALTAAKKDPLSQCHLLSNPDVGPLIYLSQSDLAVVAHYSTVDFDAFKAGSVTSLYITPLCYIKGYFDSFEILIWSGSQKCPVTPLSLLYEYPSLFFLQKDSSANRWLVLNGGEYQHIGGTSGLLLGTGSRTQDFPLMCGLEQRRIPIDQVRCDSMSCRNYCNFRMAPPSQCKDKRNVMLRYMKPEDLPIDRPPFGVATPALKVIESSTAMNEGSDKQKTRTPKLAPEGSEVYKFQEAATSTPKIKESLAKGRSAEVAPKVRSRSDSGEKKDNPQQSTQAIKSDGSSPADSKSNAGMSGESQENAKTNSKPVEGSEKGSAVSGPSLSQGLCLFAFLFALLISR